MNERQRRKIAELADVYDPEDFITWLFHPHKQLHGRSPAEAISEGQGELVVTIVDQILSGAHI